MDEADYRRDSLNHVPARALREGRVLQSDSEFFADEIFGFHVQQAAEKLFKAWPSPMSPLRNADKAETAAGAPPPVISTGGPALGPGQSGETRRALHRRRRLRHPPGARRRPDFSTPFGFAQSPP